MGTEIVILGVRLGVTGHPEVYGYDLRESRQTAVEFRHKPHPMAREQITQFAGRLEPVERVLARKDEFDVWRFPVVPFNGWVQEFEEALDLFERRMGLQRRKGSL